jgi:hypothetical protein
MFRPTLRDLFWLTIVVALGVGWWLERRRGAMWEARAEYVRGVFQSDTGWETHWTGNVAGFRRENEVPGATGPSSLPPGF